MALVTVSEGKSAPRISRQWKQKAFNIGLSVATADAVDVRDLTAFAIYPGALVGVKVYAPKVAVDETNAATVADADWVLCNDIGTAGVVTVVASKWNTIEADSFPYGFLKFVDNAGSPATVAGFIQGKG